MALHLLKRTSLARSALATPRISPGTYTIPTKHHIQTSLTPLLSPVLTQRFYADDKNTPQATSNVSGNPQSGSSQEKLTSSGARGGRTEEQSTQPVSGLEGAQQGGGLGGQEEPNQPGQGDVRPDKDKPAHEKREEVLKEGEKPLDPADK